MCWAAGWEGGGGLVGVSGWDEMGWEVGQRIET